MAPGTASLDAIIVPSAREPVDIDAGDLFTAADSDTDDLGTRRRGDLRYALQLGAELGIPIVLLCSGHSDPARALRVADAVPGAACTIVDLRGPVDWPLPIFGTGGFLEAVLGAHGDLSRKRNLGLLLGRYVGWRAILFLDDDIRPQRSSAVRRAVGTLDRHSAVGMLPTKYPDNSVVCHARRYAGGRQDVFASGSALAVHLQRTGSSFFPEIYNEDWLFLAPMVARRQVAFSGAVRQLPYRPFASPYRAAVQEFGDVVGEGLLASLHHGSLEDTFAVDYWRHFLWLRAGVIEDAWSRCERRAAAGDVDARRVVTALAAAEQARARLTPDLLTGYVHRWNEDGTAWRRYAARIEPVGNIPAALSALGLPAEQVRPPH